MNNADMPAMPTEVVGKRRGLNGMESFTRLEGGLTKLEHFAGLAMQGLLAGGYCIDDPQNRLLDVSDEAIGIAETLLQQLEGDEDDNT